MIIDPSNFNSLISQINDKYGSNYQKINKKIFIRSSRKFLFSEYGTGAISLCIMKYILPFIFLCFFIYFNN
jgi:hypothetical protein